MNQFWKRCNATLLPALALFCSIQAWATEVDEVKLLIDNKQYDIAQTRAAAYLNANPGDAHMRLLQGLSLAGMQRQTDAIAVLVALTHDFPHMAEPYNDLAVVYASAGMYDSAVSALKKAIQADPGYATAHENLAAMYAQLAQQSRENAAQVFPKSASSSVDQQAPVPTVAMRPADKGKNKNGPSMRDSSDTQRLLALVQDWAAAWSARDIKSYLDFYGPQFQPPKFEPRANWEAKRHQLIVNKKRIQVTIVSPQVTVLRSTATVRFLQKYVSDSYASSAIKVLVFHRYDDDWKIVEERSNSDLNGLSGPSLVKTTTIESATY